jgi:hypothetical protein
MHKRHHDKRHWEMYRDSEVGATNDYLYAAISQTADAMRLPSVLIWPTPPPIVYGTALSGTQLLDATAFAGTFTYTPAAGTGLERRNPHHKG